MSKKLSSFILVFALVLLDRWFLYLLSVNEVDVLPAALHWMRASYIPNDWYLDQPIGYRYLFNIIAGALLSVSSFPVASLMGRLAVIGLFADAVNRLRERLRVEAVILVPFLYLFLHNQSLVAAEWMCKTLETKAFSYCMVLYMLSSLIDRRYRRFFLFAGLAISFHVLVGGYALLSMVLAACMLRREFRGEWVKALKQSWAVLVTGLPGLIFAASNLFRERTGNEGLAAKIYVLFRVPHHTWPPTWGNPGIFVLVIALGVGLFAVARLSRLPAVRLLCATASASSVFFAVGYCLYLLNRVSLMKLYWFRFPDTFIPFILYILAAAALSNGLSTVFGFPDGGRESMRAKVKGWTRRAFVFVSCVFLVLAAGNCFRSMMKLAVRGPGSFASLDTELRDMLFWIRRHTPPEHTVLACPTIDAFHLAAERPVFVLFKQSPQSDEYMLEWYKRLTACNDGIRLPSTNGQAYYPELERHFYGMSVDRIDSLACRYHLDSYLGTCDRELPYPILYRNGRYALFDIRSRPGPVPPGTTVSLHASKQRCRAVLRSESPGPKWRPERAGARRVRGHARGVANWMS